MTRPPTRGKTTRTSLLISTVGLLAVALLVGTGFALPRVRAAAAPPVAGWLHTDGATIRTSANTSHTIKAISWFGMETETCAPHGLWQISLDQGLTQIAAMGFNTVRLPYSNQCLHAAATTSIDGNRNPTLVGKSPLQVLDAVVAGAKAHGLSVLLDRHRPDSTAQSELWYTSQWSETQWIADWTMLARRYAGEPTVVGADLHNEPHGPACWGCGDRSRDWQAAATRAGNAVLAANPKWLIVVEGVERQATGDPTWWGGGLADVKAHPVRLDVANRVVYSPHDYPASIYAQPWFRAANYPANLPGVWDRSWGYLQREKVAPVLLGEFGSRLQTTSDRQWLTTLVGYLKTNQMSFAYWSFNPDSGDTGGIVKDDWVTPEQDKLDALAPLITGTPLPSVSSSAPATTPPPSTAPTRTPTVPPGSDLAASWTLQSAWNHGYVAQVAVTSRTARSGWTLSWADPSATSVTNSWGMSCTVGGGRITCVGADWGGPLTAGQTVNVGLQVSTSGSAPQNPALTVK